MSLNIFKKKPMPVALIPDGIAPGDIKLIDRMKDQAGMMQAAGIADPHPILNMAAINNAMGQQNAAAQLYGNSLMSQAAQGNYGQPFGQIGAVTMIGAGESTKATERARVIIETVSNGFTVTCGRETYVAASIEDLANVVRVALVTARLVDHMTP